MSPLVKEKMVVTDLDGTLLNSDGALSHRNAKVLESLGSQNVLRVIATGRSLHWAEKVIPVGFPVDYLIFSSGAGVMDCARRQVLRTHHLEPQQVRELAQKLCVRQLDYSIHRPIPHTHYFISFHSGKENLDFLRRCARNAQFRTVGKYGVTEDTAATQLLVIQPVSEAVECFFSLSQELNAFKVIRATSPLDKESIWIEIFSKEVSKAIAAQWIADQNGIQREKTLAIGNDYNDLDLLAWAGSAFVVGNAPAEVKGDYRTVATNDLDGFAEAVGIWNNGVRFLY